MTNTDEISSVSSMLVLFKIIMCFNWDSVGEEKEVQCFVIYVKVELLSFYISVQNFSSV